MLGRPAPPKPVLQPLPQLPCPLLLSLPRLSLLQPLLPRLSLLQPWQRTNC
jgi:hypothetical protein